MKASTIARNRLIVGFIYWVVLTGFIMSRLSAAELELNINGLVDLGMEASYEAWVVVDDAPVSVGTFSVNETGSLSPDTFSVEDQIAEQATVVMVTIESNPDPQPEPADSRLLAGTITAGVASLSIGHPNAISDDLTGVLGQFTLANPTGDKGSSLENGIWYMSGLVTLTAGLSLVDLPEGWIYQGWVYDVGLDQNISTGSFRLANEADSDGPGPTSGLGEGLPFPGQDFISPLRDLSVGHRAFISVEPVPDFSPDPFVIRVLQADITGAINAQSMFNSALATSPSGQAQLTFGSGPVTAQPVPVLNLYTGLLLLLFIVLMGFKQVSHNRMDSSNKKSG